MISKEWYEYLCIEHRKGTGFDFDTMVRNRFPLNRFIDPSNPSSYPSDCDGLFPKIGAGFFISTSLRPISTLVQYNRKLETLDNPQRFLKELMLYSRMGVLEVQQDPVNPTIAIDAGLFYRNEVGRISGRNWSLEALGKVTQLANRMHRTIVRQFGEIAPPKYLDVYDNLGVWLESEGYDNYGRKRR